MRLWTAEVPQALSTCCAPDGLRPSRIGDDDCVAADDITRKSARRNAKLASLPVGMAGRAALGIGKRLTGKSKDDVNAELTSCDHRHSRRDFRYCLVALQRRDRFGRAAGLDRRTVLGSDYQHLPDAAAGARLCVR